MKGLFERHPLPWTCDGRITFDAYFVQDANRMSVVMIRATDETTELTVGDDERETCIITKRPRPGALRLAKMIVKLPELLAAVSDSHATFEKLDSFIDRNDLLPRLERLIEDLA